ncbi:MAG: EsaB/YukD family protein [Eubacterium sp.]
MEHSIIATLYLLKKNSKIDIEIQKNITANELVIALNDAFNLGIDTNDITQCYLKTENPIRLLKGNKKISEFDLRDGTVIYYTN